MEFRLRAAIVATLATSAAALSVRPFCPKPAVILEGGAADFPRPNGTKMREIWCDGCKDSVIAMEQWIKNGNPWEMFCTMNLQDQPELCQHLTTQINKIFCPDPPGERLRFANRFSPSGICDHYYLDCHNRPALNFTRERKPIKSIGCDVCGPIATASVKWCEKTGGPTFDDAGGFCETHPQPDECEFIAKRLTSIFFPEPVCKGLACQAGNPEQLCNHPMIACTGPDGKPYKKEHPKPTVAPFPPFIVYKDGKAIFGQPGTAPRNLKLPQGVGLTENK